MRKLLPAVLLLAACSSPAPSRSLNGEWTVAGALDNVAMVIDRASIRRDGEARYYWGASVYPRTTMTDGDAYDYTLTWNLIECDRGTMTMLAYAIYMQGSNAPIRSKSLRGTTGPINQGTLGHDQYVYVCNIEPAPQPITDLNDFVGKVRGNWPAGTTQLAS